MTDPHRRLRNALDALDVAFAPLTSDAITVGGCTHCYADSDLATLEGPVDQVPDDLISSIAAKSVGHWDDFPALHRRMTPRIVRLLATDQLHVDHGLIASRLVTAGWHDWPVPQRDALEQVWHAWWRSTLHEHPGPAYIMGVLETISVSTRTLTPWLTIWADTRTEAADRHLDDALDDWLFETRLTTLRLGFYDELDATVELVPWLLSLGAARIGATRFFEVERISLGQAMPHHS
ncbi:hypothetical protein ACE1OC_41500 [Streptomyces sp. DSM 116496]|uniref:hypothetical protein n=1 Tax=Streptomyces stoeckheimensis TaxID=3344656 RepID=UPI0038B3587B